MSVWTNPYVDAGWNAIAIILSIARIEQERSIPRDRESLKAVANALDNFARGVYEQEGAITLFSRIEGLLIFVRAMAEWHQTPVGDNIRQRAGTLAEMLRGFLNDSDQGEALRKFFQKVHDVAEEVTVTRQPFDPVVEVFTLLAKDRKGR